MAMSHIERFKHDFLGALDEAERMGDYVGGTVRMNQMRTGLVWAIDAEGADGTSEVHIYLLDGLGEAIPHYSHSRVLVVDTSGLSPVCVLYDTASNFIADWNNEQKLGQVLLQD